MDGDNLKLINQLCFPLYAASKMVVGKYKPFLDEIDLTYTQYIAMMVLWEHKRMSVKGLGECLYLDSGTLTPLLKRLEKKKYVQRERSKEDERVVDIAITELGEQLKTQAEKIPMRIAGCMPLLKEEAEALYVLLYKILRSQAGLP